MNEACAQVNRRARVAVRKLSLNNLINLRETTLNCPFALNCGVG